MYNIIGKMKYAYAFSIILTALSIFSICFWGLKFSIDFTGGTEMKIKFSQIVPSSQEVVEFLKTQGIKNSIIQATSDQGMKIRYASESDVVNDAVMSSFIQQYPGATQSSLSFFDASVSQELKKNSLWAIFWANIGILTYIAWAFRKVSHPIASWKYGLGAVVALIHDVLITIGIFSLLGHFFGIEVGVSFVAALLTILGFSVHDTIVVYDRTRENLLKNSKKELFPEVVNRSLNETLVRSINTSLTVLMTLLAIYFFGGESIRDFSLALLFGIFFGTYSSIFIASALLVTAYNFQVGKK